MGVLTLASENEGVEVSYVKNLNVGYYGGAKEVAP